VKFDMYWMVVVVKSPRQLKHSATRNLVFVVV